MITNWTAAEVILAIALLAVLMPQEEGFLLPERRDWRGALRRALSPAARRLREVQGAREADAYLRALNREPETVTLRQEDLPSARRRFETVLLTTPTEEQRDQKPPWKTAASPAVYAPGEPPAPRQGPPTIVMNAVRPAIADDLGIYLDAYPGYGED